MSPRFAEAGAATGLASLLFVPANVEWFVRFGRRPGADAIQFDLEDSIHS
ncbi:MAG: hypothetical protein ACREM8_11430 [Vulcanimicrobiaceae bacterium]